MNMKRWLLILLVCPLVSVVQAQHDPVFIFENFLHAKIHFKNWSVTVVPMNYDMANDKMYFKRDGQLMELIQLELIDSVVWAKKLCFVQYETGFLEKVKMEHGTAYIHWKVRNMNIGSRGALGSITQAKVDQVFSAVNKQNYNADIYKLRNSNDYYLMLDGSLKKATTKKQILKLFPGHEEDIERFIEEKDIKMQAAQSVLELLDYCLSLKGGKP